MAAHTYARWVNPAHPAEPDRVALPLFPLGTVLFPGLVMPLHVFEERYRSLIRYIMELPEGTPREFGELLADEYALWAAVVKAANVKVE